MKTSILKFRLLILLFIAFSLKGIAMEFSIQLKSLDTLPLTINILSENVKCFGQNNGSATSLVSGGIEPYTYLWSNNNKTPGISNLTAGTYKVTVNDAIGQITIDSITIIEPDKLEVTVNDFVFTCNTKPQTIFSTVSGGVKPYTYKWSTGQTTPDILADGKDLYKVSVTDANGCKSTAMVYFINNSNSPYINIDTVWTFNCTTPLVLIQATVDPNVNVHWSPEANIASGQNTLNPFVNKPGVYIITAIDTTNDCMNLAIVNVYGILPLTANVLTENIACNGDTSGSALIQLSGGEKPYTYTNSCCDSIIHLNNLSAGFYSITVKDNSNCADTIEFTITQPSLLNAQYNFIDLYDPNVNSGKAYCYPNGGTPPYEVNWSNGEKGNSIIDLAAGKYELTITDALGCTIEQWAYINDHQCNMVFDFNVTSPIECYSSSGTFCADVLGGVPPYNYAWTNSVNSSCLFDVPADKYGVTVTDAMGCKAMKLINFNQPSALSLIPGLYYIKPETGYGFKDASIFIIPKGGNPPYSFEYDKGTNGHLPAGKNIITVTDANGCSNQFEFNIPEFDCNLDKVSMANFSIHSYCPKALDTLCLESIIGGSAPYTYLWSNGTVDKCTIVYPDTALVLTITDAKNCSNQFHPYEFVIPEIIAALKVTNASNNKNNGTIELINIAGGIPPYTYLWNNGSTGYLLSELAPGIYCVTVTDAYGCSSVFCEEVKLKVTVNGVYNTTWSVYPNPAKDFIFLKSGHNVGSKIPWKIIDIRGKVVLENTNFDTSEPIKISVNSLIPGTYYIQIKDTGLQYQCQFQKD